MERIAEAQARLSLPDPYLLFLFPPPNAPVHGRIHGWLTRVTERYAFDFGERPPTFFVPPGLTPPAAAALRIPGAVVFLGTGQIVPPGAPEPKYAYQYVWQPFTVPVTGAVVPLGKGEHVMAMPDLPPAGTPRGLRTPDDLAVLRFRWRGAGVVAAGAVGTGTGGAGPYTLDFTAGGALAMPIVPGTVVVTAPRVAGGFSVLRDLPWPTANMARDCTQGWLIGDSDPQIIGVIDYETGQAVVTFDQAIVAAVGNIVAAYEHDYNKQPIDVRVIADINAI